MVETSPYDDLYNAVGDGLLWGMSPGRLVKMIPEWIGTCDVLDAGCGDGKNAAFLVERGYAVEGFDSSSVAIQLLRRRLTGQRNFKPERFSICTLSELVHHDGWPSRQYGAVVSYGLYHCLETTTRRSDHAKLVEAVQPGGLLVFTTLTDGVPLPPDHRTPGLTLASEAEVTAIVDQGWQVLHREHGYIDEDHLPLVGRHQHAAVWLVARRGTQ